MNFSLNFPSFNMYNTPSFMGVESAPSKAYDNFYNQVKRIVNNNCALDTVNIRDWFYKIACKFDRAGKLDEFTKSSNGLIEFLVSKNFDNMAGILCSILIKLNKNNQNMANVEDLAIRGVAIARRLNDFVHMSARANDLTMILMSRAPGSDKHVQYLKIQKEALEKICENYDSDIVKNCKSNAGELAPLSNYRCSLCYAKLDIATYAILKDPKYARNEFKQAKELYEEVKNSFPPEISEKIAERIRILEIKYRACGL